MTGDELYEQFMYDGCIDYPNCQLCFANRPNTCVVKYLAKTMIKAGWVKDTRIKMCPADGSLCIDATKQLKPPYGEGPKEKKE